MSAAKQRASESKYSFDEIAENYLHSKLEGQDRFDLALSLKIAVDDLQNNIDKADYISTYSDTGLSVNDSQRCETVILTAEYTLYKLYSDVELSLNPFLSHLIDTYISYRDKFETSNGQVPRPDEVEAARYIDVRVHLARFSMVQHILLGDAQKRLGSMTPIDLIERQPTYARPEVAIPQFSKSWFLARAAGQSSIVWRNPDALATFKDSVSALFPHLRDMGGANLLALGAGSEPLVASDITKSLAEGDVTVLERLKRLPTDSLPNLELVNQVLCYLHETSVAADNFYDVPLFIRDFIQNGLRRTEQLGRHDSHTEYDNRNDEIPARASYGARRRDDQKRAIQLLCLFVNNVLRLGYVNVVTILFEVRELCMQYIWVPEARDLKEEWLTKGGVDDGSWDETFAAVALADRIAGLGIH